MNSLKSDYEANPLSSPYNHLGRCQPCVCLNQCFLPTSLCLPADWVPTNSCFPFYSVVWCLPLTPLPFLTVTNWEEGEVSSFQLPFPAYPCRHLSSPSSHATMEGVLPTPLYLRLIPPLGFLILASPASSGVHLICIFHFSDY